MSSESPFVRKQRNQDRRVLNEYRSLAPFLTLGIQLAAAVVVFFFLGHWIDNALEISPVGKLVGLLLGCIGGFYKFFKTIATLLKEEEQRRERGKDEN